MNLLDKIFHKYLERIFHKHYWLLVREVDRGHRICHWECDCGASRLMTMEEFDNWQKKRQKKRQKNGRSNKS